MKYLFLCMALLVGCSSMQQTAYRTIGTTEVSVETAMTVWGDYVAAHHPGVKAEAQIETAYKKYQAAMIVACDLGKLYAATAVTNATAAQVISKGLQQAIADATTDVVDIQNLVTTFTK